LDLCTEDGTVRATVHDSSSPDKSSRALPYLDMELRANYGDVHLSLPRCFRGPITIRTGDDRVAFSHAFQERTTLISDISDVRVYFVGDRPRGGKWGKGDDGDGGETARDLLDELSVSGRHTSVRIRWDGEVEEPVIKSFSVAQKFFSGADRFFSTGRAG